MAATRTKTQADVYPAAARTDAYTGMLIVSLLATLTGMLFLFLDYREYPDKAPPKVSALPPPAAPAPQAPTTPAPAPPGAPATPPAGGQTKPAAPP